MDITARSDAKASESEENICPEDTAPSVVNAGVAGISRISGTSIEWNGRAAVSDTFSCLFAIGIERGCADNAPDDAISGTSGMISGTLSGIVADVTLGLRSGIVGAAFGVELDAIFGENSGIACGANDSARPNTTSVGANAGAGGNVPTGATGTGVCSHRRTIAIQV